eukprot:jgi/Mesvir1/23895/Mv10680-RA.1
MADNFDGSLKRPNDSAAAKKAGVIIGKQGSVIKQLRDETGARLKVADPIQGCEERVVIISAQDPADCTWSAAQEALFRVHKRVVEGDNPAEAAATTTEGGQTIRLLIAGSQAGSLIGKGGEIIKMVREQSGANVRVLGPEELPACALPTDRVVQITGELTQARSALELVSKQLRENPPKERPGAAVPVAAGRGGSTFPGFHGAGGLPGMPGAGVIPGMGMPHLPGFPGMPHPPAASSSNAAAAMNTNVVAQINVPVMLIGSVIGKSGSNVAQVRQLSGARVKVHDPKEGSLERTVEITGTAEQVQAAQTLVHAFMMGSNHPSGGIPGGPPPHQDMASMFGGMPAFGAGGFGRGR